MAQNESDSVKLLRQASELVDGRITADHEQVPIGTGGDTLIKSRNLEKVFEGLPIDWDTASAFAESQAWAALQMIEELSGHSICDECRHLVTGALRGQMIRGLAVGQMAVSMEPIDEIV